MQISWGTKIAALYIGFVVMIIGLVAATFRQPSQLVTKDYYQQEVGFDKKMAAQKAANSLSTPLRIETTEDEIRLQFPAEFESQNVTGQVYFYSIADASRDCRFPIEGLDHGSWQHSSSNLPQGNYEVQVQWTAAGTTYFQSKDIQIN